MSDVHEVAPSSFIAELAKERREAERRHRKYRRVQSAKKITTTLIGGMVATSAFLSSANSPDGPFQPGVDRWSTKTSVQVSEPFGEVRAIEITELASLKPPKLTGKKSDFAASLIPDKVGSRDYQEGQLISTRGYIHLVAFEKGDSDYHIQMNEKPTNLPGDLTPCVVVEIPHPLSTEDPNLRMQFAQARRMIRELCFANKAPTGEVDSPPLVEITGQLFYDLHHHTTNPNDPGGGRGKQLRKGLPMKATTVWEIHPVVKVTPIDAE